MRKIKSLIKKLLPSWLMHTLLRPYHFARAVIANIMFGFPSRGMNVVMITGTNGKTTTSAFLGKILEANGHKVGILTTAFIQVGDEFELNAYNMTVTNPFTVNRNMRRMKQAGVDWVIFEQTAHGLDQYRAWGVPYKAAVMTNLTQDHLDYFGDMDTYAEAKARMFKKNPDIVILNRDDEWYNYYNDFDGKEMKLAYGTDHYCDCRITKAELKKSGSKLKMSLEGKRIDPEIKLVGKFNAYNALCAATTAHSLSIEPKTIQKGLEALTSVPGRMEEIENTRGYKIFVDYAHTPDALKNALDTLKQVNKGRIISVFGATGDRDADKRPKMGETVANLSNVVIVTDDEPYTENPLKIREEVLSGIDADEHKVEVLELGDRRGAIQKALLMARRGDVVFIAGMGSEQFRTIGDGVKEEWDDRAVVRELLEKK